MLGDTLVPPLQIFSKQIRRYVSLISFKCLRSVPLFLSLLLYRGFAIISFIEWREIVGISWRTNSLVTTCAVSHASFGTPNQGISWVIIAYKHNRWSVKIPQIKLTVFIHHDETPTNPRPYKHNRWSVKIPQIELTVFIHHDKTPTNARSGILSDVYVEFPDVAKCATGTWAEVLTFWNTHKYLDEHTPTSPKSIITWKTLTGLQKRCLSC